MRLSNIHSILFIVCLIISFSEIKAQRTQPYTATEYTNSLGIGFDTDFFKNTPPLRGFNNTNNVLMKNIKSLGVNHLRLRSRADIFGYAGSTYDATSMKTYLDGLEVIVQACINNGVFPIISWIHHDAEIRASEADKANYINWWLKVAERMRNYTYELSFNLFTEIDDGTLRDLPLYNSWTKGAVNAIRSAGGYNTERIIIFGAPGKKSDSLFGIDQSIYLGSPYFAAEWHLYASGPDKDGGQKNWAGLGSDSDKENVDSVMEIARNFTSTTQVPTWIGAWMPYDNINGSQDQTEVEAFACYFASAAGKRGIPWAMNKLDNFYDSKRNVFVQTESIGRYDTTIVLDLQKIWQAARCYTTGSPLNLVKTERKFKKIKSASRKNHLRA